MACTRLHRKLAREPTAREIRHTDTGRHQTRHGLAALLHAVRLGRAASVRRASQGDVFGQPTCNRQTKGLHYTQENPPAGVRPLGSYRGWGAALASSTAWGTVRPSRTADRSSRSGRGRRRGKADAERSSRQERRPLQDMAEIQKQGSRNGRESRGIVTASTSYGQVVRVHVPNIHVAMYWLNSVPFEWKTSLLVTTSVLPQLSLTKISSNRWMSWQKS